MENKTELEKKSQYALVFADSEYGDFSDLHLDVEVYDSQEEARAALLKIVKDAIGEEEYDALEPDEDGVRVYEDPWYESETFITPDSMTGPGPDGMYNDVYVVKVRNK